MTKGSQSQAVVVAPVILMAPKRKTIIPKAPTARILLKAGAGRVSQTAMDAMAEALQEKGLIIAEKAVRMSRHAGRKTVMAEDVKLAAKEN